VRMCVCVCVRGMALVRVRVRVRGMVGMPVFILGSKLAWN
jgi:hypothetical protein